MLKTIVLEQALILPVNDITAMLQGQLIVAIPKVQIAKGLSFLLAPDQSSSETETLEKYRSPFLSRAEIMINTYEEGGTRLEAWATCEQVKTIHDVGQIPTLSSLTIWNQPYLEKLLKEQQYLFLTYLKVYRLPSAITIPSEKLPIGKIGKFVGLLSMECSSVQVPESLPILSDRLFEQRKKKLEDLTPPEHPELEILRSTIAHYAQAHPEAKAFDNELKVFLGWTDPQDMAAPVDKVTHITDAGNSSDGDLFEKLVRQGFVDLGFTNTLNNIKAALNPNAAGGAGGIDIYCEKPFPMVGECKASQGEKVPGGVAAQLITLGTNHLNKDQFEASVKIIFAAGKLTPFDENAVNKHKMNVMRPDTLQRLVNLKSAHPGSIDLLELEPCLRKEPFGTESDQKVNDFIDQIEKRIKIRSHVIQSVKSLKEGGDSPVSASTVRTHFNVAFAPTLQESLDTPEQAHSILIELSSPLTGYLGRTKGDNWKADRFYFLRDLIV
jgi:hypothetical protein